MEQITYSNIYKLKMSCEQIVILSIWMELLNVLLSKSVIQRVFYPQILHILCGNLLIHNSCHVLLPHCLKLHFLKF